MGRSAELGRAVLLRGRGHGLLDGLLRAARTAAPTFPPAGGPAGRRWDRFEHRVRVGSGQDAFEAARSQVMGWRMHEAAGIGVHPPGLVTAVGATVLLRWPLGPIELVAPCRVVEVVDDGRRAGFAYVTLPGHPECGQESFVVDMDDDQAVRFTIRATSRPAAWYARIGAPVTRLAQQMLTRRYLAAVAASAGDDRP